MTSFSVLICTYNRHEMLSVALDALICGTTDKPDQVVVVNGGDAQADAVVRRFQNAPGTRVELVKTVNVNLATSRNVGLPHCNGDIVAMTDDDAEVFPDWVAQMKRVHAAHPEAGAVGGAIVGAASKDNLVSRLADVVTFSSPTEPGYVRTLPGVNVSFKRAAIERLGPQDESLFRGEDVDYNWRAKRLGFEVYYDPAIRVLHHHRPSLQSFLQQHHMYGRAYYLVRHKWPDMYCIYPHRLRRPRDYLKAVNFLATVIYKPLLFSRRLPRMGDRLSAFPILVATQITWKWGMLYQKVIASQTEKGSN